MTQASVSSMFQRVGGAMARQTDDQDRWCILRTSGGRTLPLARSLASAGLEVWTPVQPVTLRRGRNRKRVDVEAAMLPTFVFARAIHLGELARLRSQVSIDHPPFSIFIHTGRAPLISGRSLSALRAEEERQRGRAEREGAKGKRYDFKLGSIVKVKDVPGFVGLTGVVEASDGKGALVRFSRTLAIEIEGWRIVPDSLQPASIAA